MNLKNTMFILVIVVFLLQMIVLKQDAKLDEKISRDDSSKPIIALSSFPLYDIAKNIAQDKLITYMILPVGVDIHSFEPNPKDMVKLHRSSLVIYSGASLEPWIANWHFKNKSIDMSKYVDLMRLDKHEHEHNHGAYDPHYWLSIANMKKATLEITKQIIALDIENEAFYLTNQKRYIEKLDALDRLYKKSLLTCRKKEILTNHDAFSYLARSYDFKIVSLSSISPDSEADAKHIIKLINHIKEHNVSTIFYESFASSQAIKTIAKESSVKVEQLQPLANITADEAKQNLSYEDIMKANLVKLIDAMECR